jgi:hypothetical protein
MSILIQQMLDCLHRDSSSLQQKESASLDLDSGSVQKAKYQRVAENFGQCLDKIIDDSRLACALPAEPDSNASNDIFFSSRHLTSHTNSRKLNSKTCDSHAVEDEDVSSRRQIDNRDFSKLPSFIDA